MLLLDKYVICRPKTTVTKCKYDRNLSTQTSFSVKSVRGITRDAYRFAALPTGFRGAARLPRRRRGRTGMVLAASFIACVLTATSFAPSVRASSSGAASFASGAAFTV